MTAEGALARLLLALWLLQGLPADAHEMDLARYRLSSTEDGLVLVLTVPSTFAALRGEAGEIAWPAPCAGIARSTEEIGTLARLTARARCPSPPAPGATIRAPWGADGAVLASASGVTVLAARGGGVELPLPGSGPRALGTVLGEYLQLGVTHILEGWDHLAFVLCLFLLASGRGLLWLVTAFTVGHSVSLALAYFGILSAPTAPTEAVIALSIVFMAREAVLQAGARRSVDRRGLLLVVLFGVVHGLGFATILGELGVATGERVTGLLAFNVGVELGQLLFIAALAALWTGLGAARARAQARFVMLGCAGSVGAYWFCGRFASLLAL